MVVVKDCDSTTLISISICRHYVTKGKHPGFDRFNRTTEIVGAAFYDQMVVLVGCRRTFAMYPCLALECSLAAQWISCAMYLLGLPGCCKSGL